MEDGEDGSDTIPPTLRGGGGRGGSNLDDDDIIGALAAIPMIDNDNESAPDNLPSPAEMGNFYVGLVCGCLWGLLSARRGMSSGPHTHSMHLMGPPSSGHVDVQKSV